MSFGNRDVVISVKLSENQRSAFKKKAKDVHGHSMQTVMSMFISAYIDKTESFSFNQTMNLNLNKENNMGEKDGGFNLEIKKIEYEVYEGDEYKNMGVRKVLIDGVANGEYHIDPKAISAEDTVSKIKELLGSMVDTGIVNKFIILGYPVFVKVTNDAYIEEVEEGFLELNKSLNSNEKVEK